MFLHKLKSFHQHNLQFLFIITNNTPKKPNQVPQKLKTNFEHFKEQINFFLNKKPSNGFNVNNNLRRNRTSTRNTLKVLSLLWTRQCECIIAQRIRRGQQMFTLYSKLWSECAFKAMLKRIRQQFTRNTVLLSTTAGLTLFNWGENKIQDEKILEHVNELEKIRQLCKDQLTCHHCNNRILIDCKLKNIKYCECPGLPHSVKEKFRGNPIPKNQWEPFIERKDMLVWRREFDSGKYSYKMYGSYNNITADDYLDVQINCGYRKKWDESVVDLRVIENDPESHSEIVYWEMKWPRFFSNRDYVFIRRCYIDENNKIIVLICQSTTHPSCPAKKNAIRVNEYWSILVIRAHTELNRPGMEFSLTYFDDPGVVLPEAMKSWIAVTGMPEFMKKMHRAAKSYKKQLTNVGETNERECKYYMPDHKDLTSKTEKPKCEVSSADDSFILREGDGVAQSSNTTNEEKTMTTSSDEEDEHCVDYDDRLDDISVDVVSPTETKADNSYWR